MDWQECLSYFFWQLSHSGRKRRRIGTAFRLGSEASPATGGLSWAGPLAAGIAVAIGAALIIGVVTLAQGAAGTNGARSSPSPIVTPVHSPVH